MDQASLASQGPSPAGAVESVATVSESVEADTPAQRRRRAVSALLLDHASLLLPVAAGLQDGDSVFESAIRGSSMWPAISSGSRLRIQLLGQRACQPGDVVFYLADRGYMVHRVIGRARRGAEHEYLLTRGDNCLAPDPPVESTRVLGRVVAAEAAAGWCPPGSPSPGPIWKRVLQAVALTAVLAGLRFGTDPARRLAVALVAFETRCHAAVARLRHAVRRLRFER